MFSSSDEVYDVSISWNYMLLSVTYNFGLRKWAKIERNDSKPLCLKTLLMDWGVYVQWAQWVSKTIRQNRMGFSCIFSWSYHVPCYPTFQPPLFSVESWSPRAIPNRVPAVRYTATLRPSMRRSSPSDGVSWRTLMGYPSYSRNRACALLSPCPSIT